MKRYNNKLKEAAAEHKEKNSYSSDSALRKEVRHSESVMRKRNYNLYLQSREWKEKRRTVLQRDDHCCVLCNSVARHVHHLTYERIYNESFYDLVSLCEECHSALHVESKD